MVDFVTCSGCDILHDFSQPRAARGHWRSCADSPQCSGSSEEVPEKSAQFDFDFDEEGTDYCKSEDLSAQRMESREAQHSERLQEEHFRVAYVAKLIAQMAWLTNLCRLPQLCGQAA